ncbi:MAG: TetR/AcrR family transcriptional regulator [Cyanobacteria bacterium TGS_CYA1]|nr:TetR/AcrR family transcriptional regulator [Cyanobacteria bacterium TGS_CYA1]
MTKGTDTREKIIERAATLFNTKGYTAASINDVMEATGLKKGGIYNHFENKDDLACQAFDFAVKLAGQKMLTRVESCQNAKDRLFAVIEHFETLSENPPLPGGCPLMNTAIESDDGYPLMQKRVQKAFDRFQQFVEKLAAEAIEQKEIETKLSPEEISIFMISTLEGALMLSKVHNSNAPLIVAGKQLRKMLIKGG